MFWIAARGSSRSFACWSTRRAGQAKSFSWFRTVPPARAGRARGVRSHEKHDRPSREDCGHGAALLLPLPESRSPSVLAHPARGAVRVPDGGLRRSLAGALLLRLPVADLDATADAGALVRPPLPRLLHRPLL